MAKLSAYGRTVVKRLRLERPQVSGGKEFVLLREYAVMSDGKVLFKYGSRGLLGVKAIHWNSWKVTTLTDADLVLMAKLGYREVQP